MAQSLSEQHRLQWIDSLAAATFVIDINHTVIYWNRACESLTGVAANSVVQTKKHWLGFYDHERPCLADLVLFDDWRAQSDAYSTVQLGKSSSRGLVAYNWCQTPAGLKYLAFEANALFDANGELIGAIETLRDISDLKYAELSLEKVSENHKKLFELSKRKFINSEEAFKTYMLLSSEQLDANRVSLWKYNHDRSKISVLYSVVNGEFKFQDLSINVDEHESYLTSLEKEGYLAFDDVSDNSVMNQFREYLNKYDIRSVLDLPIMVGNEVDCILCIENSGEIKSWTSEDKDFARSIGDIISNKLMELENEAVENKLKYYAAHDSLTGLVNRYTFEQNLSEVIGGTKRRSDNHAVLFMDLDQFKVVNDTCGHYAGDELLKQISSIVQETVRKNDTLSRLGGDEFGLLMENCSEEDALIIAEKIIDRIYKYKFRWESRYFRVGISIGIVSIGNEDINMTEVLSRADAACYMAKDKGRNRAHIYISSDQEISQKRNEMQWVSKIQNAIDEKRFVLYLQGIFTLETNTISHYEVLTRMLDENGGIVQPGNFISAAERYDLMTRIDELIIELSFEFLENLKAAGCKTILPISINLSGNSISNKNFLDYVASMIRNHEALSNHVGFELTETIAVSNISTATRFINTIKGMGCKFALDDFGSGVSSFSYLKHLPFDFLKIDGVFIKDIDSDPVNLAMVKSINEIGQVVGLETVAEYIDSETIRLLLKEIGVQYGQGFGLQKPFPAIELLS